MSLRRPTRSDAAITAAFVAYAVGEALLRPVVGPRGLAIALAAATVLPFALRRSAPVTVALAVSALSVLRIEVGAYPPVTTVYVVAPALFCFGAVAYGPRRGRGLRLAAVWLILAATELTFLRFALTNPMPAEFWISAAMGVASLGGLGTVIGFAVRDRRDDVARLREEVEALVAALPEREDEAAAAEHRRVAAGVAGLVAGLVTRAGRRLGDAERLLPADASRAGDALRDVADTARRTLESMSGLLNRIYATEPAPSGREDAIASPPAPGSARELANAGTGAPPEGSPRRLAAAVAGALRPHTPLLLLAAVGLVDHLTQPGIRPLEVRLGAALILPLPLLLRDRFPLPALAAFELLVAGTFLAGTGAQGFVAAVGGAFLAAAMAPGARSALALSAAAVAVPLVAMKLGPDGVPPATLISLGSLFAGAAVGGWLVRGRLAAATAARVEIAGLEERRREAEQRAAAEARARLARDIHDACGHAIVLVAMQAETGRARARTDAAQAGAAIGAARESLDAAVGELERLAEVTPGSRTPGLAELAPLVDRLRDAGVDVTLDVDVAGPVEAALGHAVYRLVQEALTNAAKHAAGAAIAVTLRASDGRLAVSVRNAPGRPLAVAPGGHGLRAMRERAAAHGGTVRAGPEPAGGWLVTASYPLRRAAGARGTPLPAAQPA